MSLTPESLTLLRCPLTKRELKSASADLLQDINSRIAHGELRNRLGESVEQPVEAGLIESSDGWFYAVRGGILCLLADEAIPVTYQGPESEEQTG